VPRKGGVWHVPVSAGHCTARVRHNFYCFIRSCVLCDTRVPMQSTNSSANQPQVFAEADLERLSSILRACSADSGTVHTVGPDGALHLRAAIGIPEPVLAIVKVVPMGKGMAGLAAERKCAVNSCNLQQDTTGDVRPGARATGLAGSVAVPVLSSDGRVIGVVGVATRAERTFTADEERAIAERSRAFFEEVH
jgi:L-methionine (R)-S-oxide reductase